jgi:hypothetical protein
MELNYTKTFMSISEVYKAAPDADLLAIGLYKLVYSAWLKATFTSYFLRLIARIQYKSFLVHFQDINDWILLDAKVLGLENSTNGVCVRRFKPLSAGKNTLQITTHNLCTSLHILHYHDL